MFELILAAVATLVAVIIMYLHRYGAHHPVPVWLFWITHIERKAEQQKMNRPKPDAKGEGAIFTVRKPNVPVGYDPTVSVHGISCQTGLQAFKTISEGATSYYSNQ